MSTAIASQVKIRLRPFLNGFFKISIALSCILCLLANSDILLVRGGRITMLPSGMTTSRLRNLGINLFLIRVVKGSLYCFPLKNRDKNDFF